MTERLRALAGRLVAYRLGYPLLACAAFWAALGWACWSALS